MTDILKLAEAVKKMRDAQNEFFRTKSGISLSNAKKLEAEVDKMISQIGIPSMTSQRNLFNS
ncbi:hypothetical protein [Pedobacter panaciterrae]